MKYKEFLAKHPHNLTIDNEYFDKLIKITMMLGMKGTPDEIVDKSIYNYGGTMTEALIDMIYNMTI